MSFAGIIVSNLPELATALTWSAFVFWAGRRSTRIWSVKP